MFDFLKITTGLALLLTMGLSFPSLASQTCGEAISEEETEEIKKYFAEHRHLFEEEVDIDGLTERKRSVYAVLNITKNVLTDPVVGIFDDPTFDEVVAHIGKIIDLDLTYRPGHPGFSQRQIVDLEPFSYFRNLRTLTLNGQGIDDASPLSQLKCLRQLHMSGLHHLEDLSVLSEMESLEVLNINTTTGAEFDMKLISHMENLRVFSGSGRKILNLAATPKVSGPLEMHLGDTGIVEIPSAPFVGHLTYLDVRGNKFDDAGLASLSRALNLERLQLGENPHALANLKDLPKLRELKVSEVPPKTTGFFKSGFKDLEILRIHFGETKEELKAISDERGRLGFKKFRVIGGFATR